MTQTQRILDWLAKGLPLTQLYALRQFGCMRLAARIAELRSAGHVIATHRLQLSTGKRVAQYRLVKLARRRAS